MLNNAPYRGRFAPSPTGPLHAGSLVAALASWLDARAHQGEWLVRIEDIDPPRCVAGADTFILKQLADCGLHPDHPTLWQSRRSPVYAQALEDLQSRGLAYPCFCTRKDIAEALQAQGVKRSRHHIAVYPGTCRPENSAPERAGHAAWRFHTQRQDPPAQGETVSPRLHWHDRRLGPQQQDVAAEVGDFVLKRADGLWAYQLAVVVDDAAQGITDVVRGEDLADNTARQIRLQQALGLNTPRYLHLPLVLDKRGEKLSKQHGAPAVPTDSPSQALQALTAAGSLLGLTRMEWDSQASPASALSESLRRWCQEWAARLHTSQGF